MNKKLVNIALLVLLSSGCYNSTNKQSNGEPLNKNAPLFVRPNTNATSLNKPQAEPPPTPSKPAVVNFNSEKYVMVKESDLNKLVVQKTNEVLRNKGVETKAITNEKEVNKLPGSPDEHNLTQNLIQQEESVLTVETIKLDPVKNTHNPLLSFILTTLVILLFILTVGYFFFIKRKASNETPAPTTPETPKVATETAPENPANKDTETKKD